MKKIAAAILIFLAASFAAGVIAGLLSRIKTEPAKVSCYTSEFNPDFTPAMRKACRELRNL